MNLDQIKQIAEDCQNYSHKYDCSLEEAVDDWEGDGPSGGFGLTLEERRAVLNYLEDPTCYDFRSVTQ